MQNMKRPFVSLASLQPLGIAAKAAVLSKFNKRKGTDYLVNAVGAIPGIPAKLSQIMSSKIEGDFETGNVDITPLPLEIIKSIFEKEAPELLKEVSEISESGITASLGQVHRVKLKNGDEYAIKFQYPDLRADVETQLNGFFKLAGISPAKKFGLSVEEYEKKFKDVLDGELNYETEASSQINFAALYEKNTSVVIPKINTEFTTKNMLVQSWEDSVHVKTFAATAPIRARVAAAKNIVTMFLEGLFVHGKVHSDLHPMNWGIRESTGQMVVYDFGASQEISKEYSETILKLIRSYSTNTAVRPFDYLVQIGFDPDKLQHVSNKLPTMCKKIFEPFIENQFWSLKDWEIGVHFDRVLGSDKWWFRTAGPTWFFMVIKSLSGVLEGVKSLNVNLNLHELLAATTENICTDIEVTSLKSKYPDTDILSNACANNLIIKVYEGENTKVDLTMPCRSVDVLEDLIPQSAREYISTQNINVKELVAVVQRSGYLPQKILETTGDKRFEIYLR